MRKKFTYNRKKLSTFITNNGLNVTELSKATYRLIDGGVSRETIYRMLRGDKNPKIENIYVVMEALAKKTEQNDIELIKKEIEFEVITDDYQKGKKISSSKSISENESNITVEQKEIYDNTSDKSKEPENSFPNSQLLIEIEGRYNFQQVILDRTSVRFTNYKISILSKFDSDIIDILRTPKKRTISQFFDDEYRWIKIFNNYTLILGKAVRFEHSSEDQYLLEIEKEENSGAGDLFIENNFSKIQSILNILLFNKINSNEKPSDNSLMKSLYKRLYSSRGYLTSPLYAIPVCPIPDLYHHIYLKSNNWSEFCLMAKARIIETLEILEFIDIIERLDLIPKENEKIEVLFSAILNLENESLLGSKIILRDECDLSLNNDRAFHNYMKKRTKK